MPLIAALAIIAVLLKIQPKEEIMPKGNGGTNMDQTVQQFYQELAGLCSISACLATFVAENHLDEFVRDTQDKQIDTGFPTPFPREFIEQSVTTLPDEMRRLANTAARAGGMF